MARETPQQTYWQNRAQKLSRRVNCAWFLQFLAAPLLIAAVIGAIGTLVIRRELPSISLLAISLSLLGVLAVLSLCTYLFARKRFEKPAQSLVRIEADCGLNSALSSASAGVGQWPDAPSILSTSLRWHLPKTLAPPFAALSLLALGLLIPISSAKHLSNSPPSSQPQAWSQLDSQLEQLAEDEAVDSKYIEEMEKRLEQLRSQEEEDWFSHASLEATDSLKESHNSNMETLKRDLSEAANALESLTENADKMTTEQKQKLTEDFEKTLQGLQNGAMKPNPALLDQLSKLDPKDLGKLTSEQMSELKEAMEKLQKSLDQSGQGEGQGQGDDWSDQLLGDGENGEGSGQGNGEGGNGEGENGTGSGGISRGPGHDPNVLKNEKDPLDAGELAALKAKDLSRAIPGDLLQLQDGKHTIDESASKLSVGGNASQGKGGDRIWKESLAPEEQRALKKYFE